MKHARTMIAVALTGIVVALRIVAWLAWAGAFTIGAFASPLVTLLGWRFLSRTLRASR